MSTMTLLSLKPSPYSRRVVWALELLDLDYHKEQYTSMAGEPALRWRLGRWNPWQPVTVPVAFIRATPDDDSNRKETVLENGVEIVEWANEKKVSTIMTTVGADASSSTSPHHVSSMIPPSQRSEVLEYCRLADDFQNFDRSMFLKALAHNPPSVLRAVAGDGPPDLALHVIGAIVGCFMRTKYRSTLQASVEEIQEKAQKLEKELVEKQQKEQEHRKQEEEEEGLVYLVGTHLTMADIFMSVAICGGVKNRSSKQQQLPDEHQKNLEYAVASQGFSMEEKYPVLYKWAIDISEKYKVDYSLFEEN